MSNTVTILHLYPNEMNTYGDHGNRLALVSRIKAFGFEPKVIFHHPGNEFKPGDIIIGGGGQDSAQSDVQADILKIGNKLQLLADTGTPMLMVCGLYQLFANKFITAKGEIIKGIGIFDADTKAGDTRMIGNTKFDTKLGIIYGFENHSGQTTLNNCQPFGKVLRGNGNNGKDKTEGAIYRNVIGTYAHGPVLPNNPALADFLIETAATNLGHKTKSIKFEDTITEIVRNQAKNRKY